MVHKWVGTVDGGDDNNIIKLTSFKIRDGS